MRYQEQVEKDDLDATKMTKLAALGGAFDWLGDPAEDGLYDDRDGESVMVEPSSISLSPIEVAQYLEMQTPDQIRLKGHRIGLEDIVDDYNEGYTAEEISRKFPGLDLKAIYTVIAYYLHHCYEVDAYIKRLETRATIERNKWERSRSPASHRVERVLKERWHAYQVSPAQAQ